MIVRVQRLCLLAATGVALSLSGLSHAQGQTGVQAGVQAGVQTGAACQRQGQAAQPHASGVFESKLFNEGLDAYHRGRYEEAERLYRLAAEQGDASAQVNLGNMYAYGDGVAQNREEAVTWYRRAAEQGDSAGRQLLDNLLNDLETERRLNDAARRGLAQP